MPWTEHVCNEEVLRAKETKITYIQKETDEISEIHYEERVFREFDTARKIPNEFV